MASPSRNASTLLTHYAQYHRDQRNIATHSVGVPMLVFGLGVLLAGAQFAIGGQPYTLAWVAYALAAAWYLTRGHLGIGAATSAAVGVLVLLAHQVSSAPWGVWLGWGLGFFGLGWLLQVVGHYYEGRKPPYAGDLGGLLVGPMFVTLEALASLGWCRGLAAQVEHHAGPTMLRDLAHPVAR